METTDFSFKLPEALIAQYPPAERGASRLMVLDKLGGGWEHRMVRELDQLLEPGSLLVFNDSMVRKARIFGTPLAGGATLGDAAGAAPGTAEAEFLLLDPLGGGRWRAMAKRAKRRRIGSRYGFAGGVSAEIEGEDGEFKILRFDRDLGDDWLDIHGHIPLPPYIKRNDAQSDHDRYQTVYARSVGSAAAPTAGLHFTHDLMDRLKHRSIRTAFVTLHVGLGTFLPVRTTSVEGHTMHRETYDIGEEAARAVEDAKREGRPVVAVGTTSVRTLESAWRYGSLERGSGETSIFIYPGYRFKVVDSLFTNFHTPESTLLMLVCAFAGRKNILDAYAEAVAKEYRFFSYGDAMLIR